MKPTQGKDLDDEDLDYEALDYEDDDYHDDQYHNEKSWESVFHYCPNTGKVLCTGNADTMAYCGACKEPHAKAGLKEATCEEWDLQETKKRLGFPLKRSAYDEARKLDKTLHDVFISMQRQLKKTGYLNNKLGGDDFQTVVTTPVADFWLTSHDHCYRLDVMPPGKQPPNDLPLAVYSYDDSGLEQALVDESPEAKKLAKASSWSNPWFQVLHASAWMVPHYLQHMHLPYGWNNQPGY